MSTRQVLLPERVNFSAETAPRREELHGLFDLIARSGDLEALKTAFVPAAATYFGAKRAALLIFDELPWRERPEMRDNPVIRFLLEHHAPVHEALIVAPGEWSALCPWSDHGHVLTGPIVRKGELIGALGLTRGRAAIGFDALDLTDVSALCGHLCARFSCWQPSPVRATTHLTPRVTPRERQIIELVAQGLTNAQIGARLCVSGETVKAALKVLFRKVGVRSRAELAARALQL